MVFCEVRTRQSASFVAPVATIDRKKVERIRRAAAGWLQRNPQGRVQTRFDAASVVLSDTEPLTYYEAAF